MAEIKDLKLWELADAAIKCAKYERALNYLHLIHPQSKVIYNKAWVYFQLKQYDRSIEHLTVSIGLDNYLAVAYYLRSLCYIHLHCFAEAIADAEKILNLLKENELIDYSQLGNSFIIYKSYVLYNLALMHHLALDTLTSIHFASEAFKLNSMHTIIKAAFMSGTFDGVLGKPKHFQVCSKKIKNLDRRGFLQDSNVIMNLRHSTQQPSKLVNKQQTQEEDIDALLQYYQIEDD